LLEKIIEKILLHIKTIGLIIDSNRVNNFEELDISAIASITRDIIDSVNLYYYFGERDITKEELEFRYKFSHLHQNKNFKDIICKLKFPV
jgi:hypothetical protein